MKIGRAVSVNGNITLPGDKSISHRAALFSSMAAGETRIANFAASADCSSTLSCLEGLGVEIERDGSLVTVHGVGKAGFQPPSGPLDCGNSGTTMRLITGILAGQDFESVLIGDESLSRRPMLRVIEPLRAMGAEIDAVDGHAPLTIRGRGRLHAQTHELKIASAQIKSCILLAGLNADGRTTVIEPAPTRDHTERMLRWFGADVNVDGAKISIDGGQTLHGRNFNVPGDISSAAFFLVAAACLPGSLLRIENVGLNPSRTGIIDVLLDLGVDLRVENRRDDCNEPVGDLTVYGSRGSLGSSANTVKGDIVANLIDEIPIIAILGTQLEAGLEVRNAAELRVKESDRIAAVVENLRRMNASVEEFPDGFRVMRSELRGAVVDSFGDHRIAMAFAVAGLLADGETRIEGSDCVNISFPGYFEKLQYIVSA